MKHERAKCPTCGKIMAVQAPKGGDGSCDVFPRHKTTDGQRCDMSRCEVRYDEYVVAEKVTA